MTVSKTTQPLVQVKLFNKELTQNQILGSLLVSTAAFTALALLRAYKTPKKPPLVKKPDLDIEAFNKSINDWKDKHIQSLNLDKENKEFNELYQTLQKELDSIKSQIRPEDYLQKQSFLKKNTIEKIEHIRLRFREAKTNQLDKIKSIITQIDVTKTELKEAEARRDYHIKNMKSYEGKITACKEEIREEEEKKSRSPSSPRKQQSSGTYVGQMVGKITGMLWKNAPAATTSLNKDQNTTKEPKTTSPLLKPENLLPEYLRYFQTNKQNTDESISTCQNYEKQIKDLIKQRITLSGDIYPKAEAQEVLIDQETRTREQLLEIEEKAFQNLPNPDSQENEIQNPTPTLKEINTNLERTEEAIAIAGNLMRLEREKKEVLDFIEQLHDFKKTEAKITIPDHLENLPSLPSLPMLEKLTIQNSKNLSRVNFKIFQSLTHLDLTNCCLFHLSKLPTMNSVEILEIYNCDFLEIINFKAFPNLKQLKLIDCSLETIPKEINYLNHLDELFLNGNYLLSKKHLETISSRVKIYIDQTYINTNEADEKGPYLQNKKPPEKKASLFPFFRRH